ncbi:DUF695 domain-containing protein [Spiractinospora alimapuensis]|uniref:DUF695 domain-containing protein n=1 Tax=Spiractinospora alimapuensis TaxID=2820884 RepID=UPI001F1ABC52|nr:DUF695 domain-containing protein [Spiractinospora alimapuensis]QVQ51615.1 DUF695 domain-containing protein [Spiractinospora alimapuensis]
MALFRRRRSSSTGSDPVGAITDFWAAWPEVRDAAAVDLAAGRPVNEDVSQRVRELAQRIHAGLTPVFSRTGQLDRSELAGLDIGDLSDTALEDLARLGDLDTADIELEPEAAEKDAAEYALTLTGGEDDTARVLAERWVRSAPPDGDWRFYPARQPDPDRLATQLAIDNHDVDLSHATVSLRADQATMKVDVGVYHPDNMFLPEDTRNTLARTIVILAVGEDDAVRWVGSVSALTEKPLDPLQPTAMRSVIDQLMGPLGGVKWLKAQGRVPLAGVFQLGLRYPLHRRDFPQFTLYVLMTLPYVHPTNEKLPAEKSEEHLKDFERTMQATLSDNGAVLAQRTMGGQRQYHLYLDPDAELLPALENLLSEWPEGRATLSSFTDPNWEAINQFARPFLRNLGR